MAAPNNPQVLQLGGRQSVSERRRTLALLLHLMAEPVPKLNCMQRTTSVVGSACGASTTPSRLRGALNVLSLFLYFIYLYRIVEKNIVLIKLRSSISAR